MVTARVPVDLEKKLAHHSEAAHTTKSEVVKKALEAYLYPFESAEDSLFLAESYMGKYGSGEGDLSVTYKARLKEKLHEKHSANSAKRNTH